ncbi:enoyl-CoA hydratase-related protein [Pseudonocardia sp. NPDC049154]|uniref:enoyl-CoA hydratase/isomerase family protein n=1 Tax=Pseudonocardia sp. NPDC049154 TaxID=3155501 RepID=UPI0033C7DC40
MASQTVEVSSSEDGVFVVRMANPPVNALAPELLDGLDEALDVAEKDRARVVVVASAVPRFFAAGADIKTMVDVDRDGFVAYGLRLRSTVARIAALDRPTVAAIEGSALGGGMELALACSLRVASRTARVGLPEARIGLIPSAGATQRLPRYVGRGRALELMLTARPVGAAEAREIGLVDRVCEPGEAEATARELAGAMAALSIPALMDVIALVDSAFEVPLAEGLAGEVSRVEALFDGPDAREGMRAFLEKRTPGFR